ncbi:MAG: diguanylate cyclase, partial [Vulcanimicrobiaceae bacterium]
ALSRDNRENMLGEIAYHAWAGGLRELAMQANLRCARRAMQLHAYAEAALFFARSLECSEETAPEFVPTAIALCRLRFVLGDAVGSRYWGERAIAAMRETPESRDLAYVLLVLAGYYATDGKTELAITYIDRAMGIARAINDEKIEREAHISRGSLHALLGENQEALRAFEEAGRYNDDSDLRFSTRFHLYRALARANDGQIDGALRDYARATKYAQESEEPDWIASCQCNWGSRTCAIGDLETSEDLYRRALAISRENDLAFCRGLASAGLAFVCLLRGNLAQTRELLHAEVSKSTTFIARVYASAIALHLEILDGTDATIAARMDDGLKDEVFASNQSQLIGVWAGAVASAYAELGNFDACDELCTSAIDAMESVESATWLCNAVASYATKPDTIERTRLLLERAASVDRDSASKVTLELFRARILARNRGTRDARKLAAIAAEHFADIGWKIHRASALELAGQSDEALEVYRSIRAVRSVAKIERINKKYRGRIGALTGREMQTARCIAKGMSNAEISRELGISERTVESHVASIFARLSVRTRAEIAAYIAKRTAEMPPPTGGGAKNRLASSAATRGRELVRAVALLLSSDADLARLYPQVGNLLAGYIDAQTVLIATGTEGKLRCDYLRLDGIDGVPESRDIPDDSTTARVMRTCESVIYATAGEWPTRKLFTIEGRKSPPESGLFVPIQFGGRSVGVLSVQSSIRDAYSADDLSILETCALYIGSRLATQRRMEESERFEHLAHTDPLTGLPNRRLFEEALEREWARASRSGEPVSIAMIDIDHFKSFNDTYGHLAGDSALCQVAATFRSVIERGGDIAARFGGEEFVLLLPGTDAAGTMNLSGRLRSAVQELGIPHAGSLFGVLTVSIGFYTVENVRDVDSSVAIQLADQSLYRAKEAGRNRVDTTTTSIN